MENLDLYLQIGEKHEKPSKKLLFFAGFLQMKTQLAPELILDLLSKIYEKNLSKELLEKVETCLINCNLGQIKELLHVNTQVSCLLCNQFSDDLIYLECIHSYHRECLTNYLTSSLDNTISMGCPICSYSIKNLSGVDPRIHDKFLVNYKAKLNMSNLNLVTCPICGGLAEGINDENPNKQQICFYCGNLISL